MGKRKLQIIFDANSLIHNKTGVGQFAERLLVSLSEENDEISITAYYFNFLGRKKDFRLPKKSNIDYVEIRYLPTKLLSILHKIKVQMPLEFFLKTKNHDFVIFPNFVAVPSIRKIPYCVAVHDMAFEDYPEYLTEGNKLFLQTFVRRSVIKANFILTISEFTKSRIAYHYGKELASKSLVVPIPFEPSNPEGKVRKSINSITEKPFLLHVGTIEPRKNIENLIRGFALLPEEMRQKYQLILAGGAGWKSENIFKAIKDTENLISVVLPGYINENERDLLYKKSTAVCMLSHYEGFGMPILEAFHYKKPLLLSSIDVFHEVAKDQATFCDQINTDGISKGIIEVIENGKPTVSPKEINWKRNIDKVMEQIKETLK